MAETLAWKFFRRLPGGADVDELRSIAFEALVRAAGRWVDPYCSARGYYPWDERDPSRPEGHFGGYVAKTVNGALLDWARHQDHVSRSTRYKVKALRAAQDGGARGEAEAAAMAGLTLEKAREVLGADAARPVSLDDHPDLNGAGYGGIADDGPDVESQAGLRETLAGFMAAFGGLDPEVQVVLAMRYHREMEFGEVAEALRTSPERVIRLHDAGVCAIHSALLMAVSA